MKPNKSSTNSHNSSKHANSFKDCGEWSQSSSIKSDKEQYKGVNNFSIEDSYKTLAKYLSNEDLKIKKKALGMLLSLMAEQKSIILRNETVIYEIIKLIISGCLTSSNLKEKAITCLLELAAFKETHQSFITATNNIFNREEEVVIAALKIQTQLLKNYGNEYFPIKNLNINLIDTRNVKVKLEVFNYLKEAYKWDKPVVDLLLHNEPEILKQLLKYKQSPPRPIRTVKFNEPKEQQRGEKNEVNKNTKDNYIDTDKEISLEDATRLIYKYIPPNILAQFDMIDIKERELGFQLLNTCIHSNNVQPLIESIAIWLKRKLKDYNQPELTQYITLVKSLISLYTINKRFAYETISLLIEKIHLLQNEGIEVILNISETISPIYISSVILNLCNQLKSTSVLKGGLLTLNRMIEEYGPKLIAVKLSIEFAKQCLSNPAVQSVALRYILMVYGMVGECMKVWICSDMKDRSLENELAKVKTLPLPDIKRNVKGETAELCEKYKEIPLIELLMPHVDISPQITPKLLTALSHSSVKQRQDAKNTIERILASVNYRILPIGLTPLMKELKDHMNEPYKNLLKSFIILVGNIAQGMGEAFKEYTQLILQPLIYNLADKQVAVREETLTAIDKIAKAVGVEVVLNNVGSILQQDNFGMKDALLVWIIKNEESLGKCTMLIKPILEILEDKSKEIRALGEQVLELLWKLIGYEVIIREAQGMSEDVIKMVDKVAGKEITNPNDSEHKLVNNNPTHSFNKAEASKSPMNHLNESKLQQKHAKRALIEHKPKSRQRTHERMYGSTNDLHKFLPLTQKQTLNNTRHIPISKSNSKSSLNEIVVLAILGNKDKRNEVDKNERWPIHELRKDYIEKLKKTLKSLINSNIMDMMFSMESKKNLEGINILIGKVKNEFKSMLDLFDLFSKWMITKLIDQPNTLIISQLFEFIQLLLKKMVEIDYELWDFEAAAIIPILCEKLGMSNLTFKQQIKNLLELILQLYTPAKVANCIVWTLNNTRNKKTKLECLILIHELIKKYPNGNICSLKNLRSIAAHIDSIEIFLRTEALEIIVTIYKTVGNSLWILMGELPDRIKQTINKKLNSSIVHLAKKRATTPMAKIIPITSETPRKIMQRRVQCENRVNTTVYKTAQAGLSNSKIPSEQVKKDKMQVFSLEEALDAMRSESTSSRVAALMYLNEKIFSNSERETLIGHCDQIVNSFIEVLDELFLYQPQEIPIGFTKYFMTIVSKVSSDKSFISKLNEDTFLRFVQQLLPKLVYEGLDKLGDNNEGEYLLKALNTTMFKLLESYDVTKVIKTLIKLFAHYRDVTSISNVRITEILNLIVKCILKMIKTISTSIKSLNVPCILTALDEYLLLNTDDIGIRIAKSIIYELVNSKGESIWEEYNSVQIQNTHIKRWISLLLESKSTQKIVKNDKLEEIFNKLKEEQSYQQAIKELSGYIKEHPKINLSPYFSKHDKAFEERIMNSLNECNTEEVVERKKVISDSVHKPLEVDYNSPHSMYKSKLELLKKKFDLKDEDYN